MKSIALYSLFTLFMLSCGVNNIPTRMPPDFRIEYSLDGGLLNEHRNVVLRVGECKDEGRKNDSDFAETYIITDKNDMESLYVALKNIHAFTLKFRTENEVYDRGGESIKYTINGKTYEVRNSGSDFIDKKDAGAFGKSVFLILDFMDSFKDKYLPAPVSIDTVKVEPEDSTIIENPQEQVSQLPDDFTIQYDYEAGMTGDHQTIVLTLGDCSMEGNKIGESFQSKKWKNNDKRGFEQLYLDLKKLNAFNLKYTEKGQVYDRGGENLIFTMNGKKLTVKNMGNCFIDSKHADAFKKAVKLVLDFASKSGK